MSVERQIWNLPGRWQLAWLVGFVADLLATAFFGTFVGVALQAAKWWLLLITGPAFLLCAWGLYALATLVKQVIVDEKSLTLEAASFEREIPFDDIEEVLLIPTRRGWRVGILCKDGGGYRLRARTRAWADALALRGGIRVVEPEKFQAASASN